MASRASNEALRLRHRQLTVMTHHDRVAVALVARLRDLRPCHRSDTYFTLSQWRR